MSIVKRTRTGHLWVASARRTISVPELASRIRSLRVVDAETGGDVTRETLTTFIAQGRRPAGLLELLARLVRLGAA